MKAPVSTPRIELQMRWSAMRASSIIITRMYCARLGTVTPSSFSTVMCQPMLLMGDEQ